MHDFRKKYRAIKGDNGCYTQIFFPKGLKNTVMGKTSLCDNGKARYILWCYERVKHFGIDSPQCAFLPNVVNVRVDGDTVYYEMERYSHTMGQSQWSSTKRYPHAPGHPYQVHPKHSELVEKHNNITNALYARLYRFMKTGDHAISDLHNGNIMYDQRRKQWVVIDLGVRYNGWDEGAIKDAWCDPHTVIDF